MGRSGRWFIAVLALFALALAGPAAGARGPNGSGEAGPRGPEIIDPAVRAEMAAARAGETVEALVVMAGRPDLERIKFDREAVIAALRRAAAQRQRPVLLHLERRGGELLNSFWMHNMVLVRADSETLQEISELPQVARIVPNFEVMHPEPVVADGPAAATVEDCTWGVDRIGAHRVGPELGLDGSGVRVATLDTGVTLGHPDLAGKMLTDDPADPHHPGGWMEFDAAGNPVASTPRDSANHGTHVAGTIHGGSTSGIAIGVAPGAQMMHGLVIPGGSGTFAQVVAGMQWAVEPFDRFGDPAGQPAHVVNMSLGAVGHFQEMIEPTRNMYFAGVFPAFAIGNNCGANNTASPGNVFEAVAVGATDDADNVAAFSCGGVVSKGAWPDPPDEWPDSYVKPDISAPGVNVLSADPAGGYRRASGTSMATPHVAGTVALMREGDPALTVDDAFGVLADTSFFDDRHGVDRPNIRYGHGRIDAFAAVELVALSSGVEGTVTDAATGESVGGVTVTVPEVERSVATAGDGGFRLRLTPGTYTLELTRFGYEARTVTDVAITEGAFTRADVTLDPLPSGDLTGTVTYEPSGFGVPGATVRVLDVPVDLSGQSDVDGAYSITRVPEGTYEVRATAPGLLASEVATITVVADETVAVDLAVRPPPPRTAVVSGIAAGGDQMVDFLRARDIEADRRAWSELLDLVDEYPTIILTYGTATQDPGESAFLQFLADTDTAGTGLMFLDHAFTTRNGLRLLSDYTGQPESTGSTTASGGIPTYYQVTNEHPVVAGFEIGDTFDHDVASTAGWIAWFDGYEGDGRQVIADMGRTDATGIYGRGIGVDQRPNNRHVLLSSHGVSATRDPRQWSEGSAQVFLNALDWVSPDVDEPHARFAVWDLRVEPDEVLHFEDVTVSAGVKNVGELAGDYEAVLRVDGVVEETTTVTVGPDADTRVEFTVNRTEVGTYTVTIGPLDATFRVRPPRVTVQASTLEAPPAPRRGPPPGDPGLLPEPMADATVELVTDLGVLPRGHTDDEGELTFDSTASIASYTLVVRRHATDDHPHGYLVTQPVTVDDDVVIDVAPHADDVARADLAFTPVTGRHAGRVYLANADTAPWGFAQRPGNIVATPGTYTTMDLQDINTLDSHWLYPGVLTDRDWTTPGSFAHRLGGQPQAGLADVREQAAPAITVDWEATDGHDNPLASVLQIGPHPFVAEDVVELPVLLDRLRDLSDREHLPLLRLRDPDGGEVRAGTMPWAARPFTFQLQPADVVPGLYSSHLAVDTGPWDGVRTAEATLIVPARELSTGTVAPGGTFISEVRFDAPAVAEGEVMLQETLPPGFTIVGWSAFPPVVRGDFADGAWTWRPTGRSRYQAGQIVQVTYTVRVDEDVAPGAHEILGEVHHIADGLLRAVAGHSVIEVEP